MKQKKFPVKLPGQKTGPSQKDQILQQKEQERLGTMYGIFRCIFEQQCINLGIEEVCVLEYSAGGVIPVAKRQQFHEREADSRMKFMEGRIKDFHAMTKQNGGSLVQEVIDALEVQLKEVRRYMVEVDSPPPPADVLVGKDGLPLKKDVAPEDTAA